MWPIGFRPPPPSRPWSTGTWWRKISIALRPVPAKVGKRSSAGSADDLFPTFAGTGRNAIEIFRHHVPVDHGRLGGGGRKPIGHIGAANGQHATDDDAQDEAHVSPPARLREG